MNTTMQTIQPTQRINPAVRHFLSIRERFDQRRETFIKRTFTPAYQIAFRSRKKVTYSITNIPAMVMHDQNPKWRKRDLVIRRQVGMAVAHIFCGTTSEAGKIFGKDHATVLHAIKCMGNAVETRDNLIMPLLTDVFSKFYRQHLENKRNYIHLNSKDRMSVESIDVKIGKYTFSKLLTAKSK